MARRARRFTGGSGGIDALLATGSTLGFATPAEIEQYRTDVAVYRSNVKRWEEETPKATRNSAIGALTALLLGLVGSVLGGWMASGEPMTFSHYRNRNKRVGDNGPVYGRAH